MSPSGLAGEPVVAVESWEEFRQAHAVVPPAIHRGLVRFVSGRASLRSLVWTHRIERRRQEMRQSDRKLHGLAPIGGYRLSSNPEYRHSPSTLGGVVTRAAKRPIWCRMLYTLAEAMQPQAALEMGTCVGVSTAYIAAAMRRGGGRLHTLEGSADFSAVAAESLGSLGLGANTMFTQGLFRDTLPGTLAAAPAWDFVFIDGHHDGQATLDYLDMIRPRLADTAFVIFDDIRWSADMTRAWGAIQASGLFPVCIDFEELGVCARFPSDRSWRMTIPVETLRSARQNRALRFSWSIWHAIARLG